MKNKSVLIFNKIIRDHKYKFFFLTVLLIFESLIITSSLITLIPIVDFIKDPNLREPNQITLYIIEFFNFFSIPVSTSMFILTFIILEIIKLLLSLFIIKNIIKIRLDVHYSLFVRLYSKIINAEVSFFDKFKISYLLNVLNIFTKDISASLANIANLIAGLSKCVIYLILPLYFNHQLVLLTFIVLLLVFSTIYFLKKKLTL